MATRSTQLRRQPFLLTLLSLGLALLSACNDGRIAKSSPLVMKQLFSNNRPTLAKVAAVKFQSEDTTVNSMVRVGNMIHMTGQPFGYSGWSVDDPENPNLSFDIAGQLTNFAMKLPWVFDWYASGAVGVMGNTTFLSGTAGVSVVNITQQQAPKEIFRKPPLDGNGKPQRDFAFTYRAIVPNPFAAGYYGFSSQDNLYPVAIAQNDLVAQPALPYSQVLFGQAGGGPVCCVRSAVSFQGTIYVAFGTRLAWFAPTAGGGLVDPGELSQLQADNVAISDQYLVVHHTPSSSQPSGVGNPKGFYYFNSGGQLVNYVPSNVDPKVFTLNATGQYIYLQTKTGIDVEIHRVTGL